jgi:ribosomal 30S subunit maturation factor RimM
MFHMASDLSVRDPFFSIDLYKLSSHNDQKEEAGKMTPVMESSHNDQEEEAEKMTPRHGILTQ